MTVARHHLQAVAEHRPDQVGVQDLERRALPDDPPVRERDDA